MSPRVVRRNEPHDVYIGRPTKWGNPFIIGRDGTRDEVIDKYAQYICETPRLLADLHELRGKTLACWCAPQRCRREAQRLAGILAETARKSPQCPIPS